MEKLRHQQLAANNQMTFKSGMLPVAKQRSPSKVGLNLINELINSFLVKNNEFAYSEERQLFLAFKILKIPIRIIKKTV